MQYFLYTKTALRTIAEPFPNPSGTQKTPCENDSQGVMNVKCQLFQGKASSFGIGYFSFLFVKVVSISVLHFSPCQDLGRNRSYSFRPFRTTRKPEGITLAPCCRSRCSSSLESRQSLSHSFEYHRDISHRDHYYQHGSQQPSDLPLAANSDV